MQKLKFPITKNDFVYDLVKRKGRYCVVSQTNLRIKNPEIRLKTVHYELWHIRVYEAGILWGKQYPKREAMPCDEDWGTYGWTYFKLADALKDFDKLTTNIRRLTSEMIVRRG
jgi:hypothetical protein